MAPGQSPNITPPKQLTTEIVTMFVCMTSMFVMDLTRFANMDAAATDATAIASINASSSKALSKAYRCKIQGCKVTEEKPKLRCACGECNRVGHSECYIHQILDGTVKRNHFVHGVDVSIGPLDRIACSVKCYRKCYQKYFVDIQSRNVCWKKDGKEGPNDPNNSEAILLQWLTEPGNYS